MNYTIVLINKHKLEVTEEELQNILGFDGITHIKRLNKGVQKNSISHYYPSAADKYKRNEGNTGILHDGTPVVRQFGRWFVDNGNRDENGYLTSAPDLDYYPEVAKDCVPSPEVYQKEFEQLSLPERRIAITGQVNAKMRDDQGLIHISRNL